MMLVCYKITKTTISWQRDVQKKQILTLYLIAVVCLFAGYQLLSWSRGAGCDDSWTKGAHAAANHFPPGTRSRREIPTQVSHLCLCHLKGWHSKMWTIEQSILYLLYMTVCYQWWFSDVKRRQGIDLLSWCAPDYTLRFVIANSSVKITISPTTHCRLKLQDELFRSKLRLNAV